MKATLLRGPRRKVRAHKLVQVRNAVCPLHNTPVYLAGRRIVCPGCERYTITPLGAAIGRKGA